MKIKDLLTVLINSSEKAASIARACRSNQSLFSLLIEEKTGEDKNQRFFQDFKTLADVLIQETIRYDVGCLFPAVKDNIKGEESNKFENSLGEKIVVEINNNSEATFQLLSKVLDKNENAARELSSIIHSEIITEESQNLPDVSVEIDNETIGIWIDPIDGTAEYINGNNQPSEIENIYKSGLQCATVLIGVYDKLSGVPFMGILNQPFAFKNDSYKSKILFGVAMDNFKYSNVSQHENLSSDKIAIISSSEIYNKTSFKTIPSAGAGYKALKVIEGHADIYYLSKGSTFYWDTCAVQAILKSLNGDIIEMKSSINNKRAIPLNYKDSEKKCNLNGIIAYRSFDNFLRLTEDINLS